jgi:hypothetical protein
MKTVPLMTSASSGEPFNDRQPFDAASISLKTVARHAARLPIPFVLSCLGRTVANTLSIGLVVLMCTQHRCSFVSPHRRRTDFEVTLSRSTIVVQDHLSEILLRSIRPRRARFCLTGSPHD